MNRFYYGFGNDGDFMYMSPLEATCGKISRKSNPMFFSRDCEKVISDGISQVAICPGEKRPLNIPSIKYAAFKCPINLICMNGTYLMLVDTMREVSSDYISLKEHSVGIELALTRAGVVDRTLIPIYHTLKDSPFGGSVELRCAASGMNHLYWGVSSAAVAMFLNLAPVATLISMSDVFETSEIVKDCARKIKIIHNSINLSVR